MTCNRGSHPRVWVTGHQGTVGSAVLRRLASEPIEIITVERRDLDLEDQGAVNRYLNNMRPDQVFHCAAKVGGIVANRDFPAEFIYRNLMITANVIHAAHMAGVSKLIYVASSAIYPNEMVQPISESSLMKGPIEGLHKPYSVSKIAGIVMCQAYRDQYGDDFICAVPTNIYGPCDNFDLRSGHVVPTLIQKVHNAMLTDAEEVTIWGTGKPLRELLHVDDLADALVFLMKWYSSAEPINVGYGEDISILELTRSICRAAKYTGKVVHDLSKPDGVARKLIDSSKINALGWKPAIELHQGLASTYKWFCEHSTDEARTGRS